jgi:hypothetical protein
LSRGQDPRRAASIKRILFPEIDIGKRAPAVGRDFFHQRRSPAITELRGADNSCLGSTDIADFAKRWMSVMDIFPTPCSFFPTANEITRRSVLPQAYKFLIFLSFPAGTRLALKQV